MKSHANEPGLTMRRRYEEESLAMQIRHVGPVDVISLSGKIMGGGDTDDFRQEVHELLHAGHRQILVDMHNVEWMNSQGLGCLVGAFVTVNKSGGRIAFADIDPVRKLFMITRLYEVFDCYETLDEGIASFAAERYT